MEGSTGRGGGGKYEAGAWREVQGGERFVVAPRPEYRRAPPEHLPESASLDEDNGTFVGALRA